MSNNKSPNYRDNKGTGALWENGKVNPTLLDPIYTGTYTNENGEACYISVWENTNRQHNRQPAFRFRIRTVEEAKAEQQARQEQEPEQKATPAPNSFDAFDDDMPF